MKDKTIDIIPLFSFNSVGKRKNNCFCFFVDKSKQLNITDFEGIYYF